jgi:hypothetical protein
VGYSVNPSLKKCPVNTPTTQQKKREQRLSYFKLTFISLMRKAVLFKSLWNSFNIWRDDMGVEFRIRAGLSEIPALVTVEVTCMLQRMEGSHKLYASAHCKSL